MDNYHMPYIPLPTWTLVGKDGKSQSCAFGLGILCYK